MRHIRDCFNAKFSQICIQAQRLNELTAIVKRYLPEFLHDHCHVLGFQNGCLVLGTLDATWGSQLRYLLPELRDQLRTQEKWYQLASIKIVINMEPITRSTSLRHAATPVATTSPWQMILQSLRASKSE